MEVSGTGLAQIFAGMRPLLDERQRRALAGLVARSLGRGGVARVAEASGMSRKTISTAVAEVDAGLEPSARVRVPGAGRKRLIDIDPELVLGLDDLIEPEARGDPTCPLRWTCKSTRTSPTSSPTPAIRSRRAPSPDSSLTPATASRPRPSNVRAPTIPTATPTRLPQLMASK